MKLPISWLREWIDLEAAPEAVAEALTRRGFYVEGVERHGHAYPGVVTARVLEVTKHPNADKLSLCRVDRGGEELRIVCGATNVRAGMIVPLATIGSVLPGDFRIEKRKVRGEESQGMICSARELGLGDDHQGILDLEAFFGRAPEVGVPFASLMPPPDAALEVEIPFNRPDGLGVVGLAREVRAALGTRWTPRARAVLDAAWTPATGFDLALEDPEGCPTYLAQAVENVRIERSPDWLREKLEAMGQRAISNVVDLTNLVLFELGQPLHAFDLDRLSGPAIRVRRALAGERLTTLDGKARTLDPEVLLICDAAGPTAIAGVMGGEASEVHDGTTRLLLECAWFDPRRTRRSARSLGLTTEASKRFERGVDPALQRVAMERFLRLLLQIQPAARLGAGCERRVGMLEPRVLTLRTSRIARVTGRAVGADDARRLLESLEFSVEPGDPLKVTVPSWRLDCAIEDDLVEEVARADGYDRIPDAPLETGGTYARRSSEERLLTRAREAMRARGLHEAWTTTLVSEAEATRVAALLGEDDAPPVRLANALSRDHEALRPNPLPGLLRACAHNLKQGAVAVRLFEVGTGFRASGQPLPLESPMLAALVSGPRYAHAHDADQKPVDFAEARGLWEAFFTDLRVDSPEWAAYSGPGWKVGAAATLALGTSRIGWAGTLSQPLLREWDIEVPANHDVHVLVVRFEPLFRAARATPRVSLPGRFPPVRRDLAFFIGAGVTHAGLEATLREAAGEWLSSIEVFDEYAGPGTPEGMKSLAYALQWQHPERTLAESEIQAIQDRMVAAVTRAHGGRLRER